MKKNELINSVSTLAGLTKKDAERAIEAVGETIVQAMMCGDHVVIPSVGKLSVKTRAARAGRNPSTGEAIHIPAKRAVKFTPTQDLITHLN